MRAGIIQQHVKENVMASATNRKREKCIQRFHKFDLDCMKEVFYLREECVRQSVVTTHSWLSW